MHLKFDFEVLILLCFSFLGLFILIYVNDFLAFVLSLELYSIPTYILVCYKTYSPKGTEAGLKYFILGCLSSSILLFGISCIYLVTGCTNYNDLQNILFIT